MAGTSPTDEPAFCEAELASSLCRDPDAIGSPRFCVEAPALLADFPAGALTGPRPPPTCRGGLNGKGIHTCLTVDEDEDGAVRGSVGIVGVVVFFMVLEVCESEGLLRRTNAWRSTNSMVRADNVAPDELALGVTPKESVISLDREHVKSQCSTKRT